jgi:hypothetical protein
VPFKKKKKKKKKKRPECGVEKKCTFSQHNITIHRLPKGLKIR